MRSGSTTSNFVPRLRNCGVSVWSGSTTSSCVPGLSSCMLSCVEWQHHVHPNMAYMRSGSTTSSLLLGSVTFWNPRRMANTSIQEWQHHISERGYRPSR